uniref:Uncharacterized protein n=1 Tax=Tanacetum cinerariifolium TaxID=118510 RepID=A0A6L2NA12_TANCI|nr:hypothetical protein [Tanacetum cinerariifolium]
MDRRPMITELRSIVGLSDWTEVLRRNLVDELCSVRSVIAHVKVVELLNDNLTKDEAKMAQLRELERQLELRALEKELFIQRLVQNAIAHFTEVDLVVRAGGDWVQMMSLYCESSVADEHNFVGRLSDLLQEMINAYEKSRIPSGAGSYARYCCDSQDVITMAWLPMCDELRSTSNSVHWEPMFILYCQRSVCEDYRLVGLINRAATKVNDTIMVRD